MVATYCTYGAAAFSCDNLRGKLVSRLSRFSLSSLYPAVAPAVEGTAGTELEGATGRRPRARDRPGATSGRSGGAMAWAHLGEVPRCA